MLDDAVSIMIPTMNRSEFIARSLKYYSKAGFKGQILIGDSSNETHSTLIHKHILNFQNSLNIVYRYYPNPPFFNDAVCLKELINLAQTPFLVYSGDDDLLIPKSLSKSAEFLFDHNDYSAAHGHFVVFVLRAQGAIGQIVETYHTPGHNIHSQIACERWKGYIRQAVSTQYYVHRKATWQYMYADLEHVPIRYLGPEVLPCSLSVIAGKVIELDILSTLFQVNYDKPFGWGTHSLYSLSLDPNWSNAVSGLRNVIVRELVSHDNIPLEEAQKCFDKEWWRHILIMMQAHYDSRGYPANTPFSAFKRKYKWVVKLWNVVRRLKKFQYKNLALNQLLKPSNPYNSDFMPAYKTITGVY
jgi:glycosyltransferase domain-containing protein